MRLRRRADRDRVRETLAATRPDLNERVMRAHGEEIVRLRRQIKIAVALLENDAISTAKRILERALEEPKC